MLTIFDIKTLITQLALLLAIHPQCFSFSTKGVGYIGIMEKNELNIEKNLKIKDFLDYNKESFIMVGILVALVTLLTDLSVNWIGYLLSFFMTTSLVFIWSEIDFKPTNKDDLKLLFLKWFFKFSYWLLILYILLRFRVMSAFFLFFPISIIFIYWSTKILRKSNKVVNILGSEKVFQRIVAFIIVMVVIVLSLLLAWIISLPINFGLDELHHLNSKINLY